jgi:hypothetical protein
MVPWSVEFHEEYEVEFLQLEPLVQDEILSLAHLLEEFGPMLKRPHCDTLKGSSHTNMKELRFSVPSGEWRVAFAFDLKRSAILLVGGSKSGVAQSRFYKALIQKADRRFDDHLASATQ